MLDITEGVALNTSRDNSTQTNSNQDRPGLSRSSQGRSDQDHSDQDHSNRDHSGRDSTPSQCSCEATAHSESTDSTIYSPKYSPKYSPMYSLAHLTLIECSAPELVYIAARSGYDAVSPRFIPMNVAGEFACWPNDNGLVDATKMALKTTGLKVLEMELARITDECDPRSFSPAIELGGELGAKRLIMSAWTSSRDDRNFLIDCYAETCQLAAPYGISVDLEFPSFSRLRTLDEALDIVRAAQQDNSGILIDTLYMHLSRVDIAELSHIPSEYLNFVHVSDALPGIADTREGMIQLARDARLYPGEGCIQFERIIERLPPLDYSIELPNKTRTHELGFEEHARRCLSHARRVFGDVRSRRQPTQQDTLTANTKHNKFKEIQHGT